MPTVRVVPSEITFDVEPSEPILAAAWRHGIYWPTTCNGEATCGVCVFSVIEGGDALSTVEDREDDGLALVRGTARSDQRLACQARAAGDVVIRKMGVRREG